ncbi:hypothetical protein AAHE18_09G032700 [Arachis hypogaea]|uniref:Uncharacterized protein n=1 Tax=Arachis hypogaea TaxID=3818 RepID=A0A445BPM3_ARAHY|nr:hypothetical protein Ahy_A09g046379 isoform C [Arachis hypogaea]
MRRKESLYLKDPNLGKKFPMYGALMRILANPTALLLSGVPMLRHLNLNTIADGKYGTADLGSKAKTITNAIIDSLINAVLWP